LFRATGRRPRGATDDVALARQMRRLMPAYFFDLDAMRRFGKLVRDAGSPSAAALQRVPEDFEPWVEQGLPTVDVPALVLTGRFDIATTPAEARHIVDLLPRARLEILERSGHHPWAEEPERFVALLQAFLGELDPQAG